MAVDALGTRRGALQRLPQFVGLELTLLWRNLGLGLGICTRLAEAAGGLGEGQQLSKKPFMLELQALLEALPV